MTRGRRASPCAGRARHRRARRDANGRWWRAGASRIGLESAEVTEQRRRQRIDAAARMLNHVVTLVVWIGVTIAVFHLFDIDAAFFLSSAGFIGAGVAIGGQHKVNDYLTGLSVLFEDRYGVGDELVVDVGGGERVHAVVDNIGLVTTRLRDETSTLHVPNAQLTVVRNLSQEASAATVRLRVPDVDGPDGDALGDRGAARARRLGAADRRRVRRRPRRRAQRATGQVDVAVQDRAPARRARPDRCSSSAPSGCSGSPR